MPLTQFWHRARRWGRLAAWVIGIIIATPVLAIILFRFVDPPGSPYMLAERLRRGAIDHQWLDLVRTPSFMARSVVAAEDADFCLHWGLDVNAIRAAAEEGWQRGGSTLSQQTAKNLLLWQGRSWLRKALEIPLTLGIEAAWPKWRILEIYMNLAEFDAGVFGVAAGAQGYFGKPIAELSEDQMARLAAVLPAPRRRDAGSPDLAARAAAIADGARTIDADGRDDCFAPRLDNHPVQERP